ncbi:MAG: hypothetical protein WC969_00590 [Elusimicrobiota bacterium]|jgi:hypothetical protein
MMSLMQFPVQHQCGFLGLALIVSTLYGVRGIAIEVREVKNENAQAKRDGKEEWRCWQILLVHYFQDFMYNFVGSLAGWTAVFLLSYRLFLSVAPPAPPLPEGFVLTAPNLNLLSKLDLTLALVALLGITGKLPQTVEGFIHSIGKAVETVTGKLAKQ